MNDHNTLISTWTAIYDALRPIMSELDNKTLAFFSQVEGNQAVADTAADEIHARWEKAQSCAP